MKDYGINEEEQCWPVVCLFLHARQNSLRSPYKELHGGEVYFVPLPRVPEPGEKVWIEMTDDPATGWLEVTFTVGKVRTIWRAEGGNLGGAGIQFYVDLLTEEPYEKVNELYPPSVFEERQGGEE